MYHPVAAGCSGPAVRYDPAMIREATAADAEAVRAIYEPYVRETAISFEDEVPSVEEMAARIAGSWSWLVYELDGRVVGYAYAGRFHARPAYRWSCEVSVYLAADAHRRGIGRALVTALLERVRDLGMVNAFAGIALPNAASQGLFESLGFERAATYESVGYKLGSWHDVDWFQLGLREPTVPPPALPA